MKGVAILFDTINIKAKEKDKSVGNCSSLIACPIEPGVTCVHMGGNLCKDNETCGIVEEYRNSNMADYKLHEEI